MVLTLAVETLLSMNLLKDLKEEISEAVIIITVVTAEEETITGRILNQINNERYNQMV